MFENNSSPQEDLTPQLNMSNTSRNNDNSSPITDSSFVIDSQYSVLGTETIIGSRMVTVKDNKTVAGNRKMRQVKEVKKEHLKETQGFKCIESNRPDGACLTNCISSLLYENEDNSCVLKRDIHEHLIQYWPTHYHES